MLQKSDKTESNLAPAEVRGKLFYGWVVAIAGAVALLVNGNFQYSFGAFVKPLVYRFGWSRAAISGCVSTRYIMSGVASPVAGILSDRYEPRRFMLIGIFIVGLGYLLGSQLTSLWQLYLFLGAFTGIGVTFYYIPMIATVTRWFGGKSALANGIAMSGFSLAQIVTPPLATYLIFQYSLETCFITLGIASLVIGTGAWLFIKTPPDIANQIPEQPIKGDAPEDNETPTKIKNDYPLSKALSTKALWILLLIYAMVAACFQMVIIHIIPAAIDTGISHEAAAIIVTLCGITNTLGRLTLSGLASKVGNKPVLTLCLGIQVLSLFFLTRASDTAVFYAIAAAYGLAYGGISPLIPTLAASFFGTKSLGSIFGSLSAAYTAGAAISPFMAGYIFDVTGSYYIAFLTAAIVTTMVLLLSLLLKPPRRKAIVA